MVSPKDTVVSCLQTVVWWAPRTRPFRVYKQNLSECSYRSEVTLLRWSGVNSANIVQENGLLQGRCWLWNGVAWHSVQGNVRTWEHRRWAACDGTVSVHTQSPLPLRPNADHSKLRALSDSLLSPNMGGQEVWPSPDCKDRQCSLLYFRYNVTVRRVRATIVVVEK